MTSNICFVLFTLTLSLKNFFGFIPPAVFDTSEFVWEQKTDSTRINFDNYKNKDWIENIEKDFQV